MFVNSYHMMMLNHTEFFEYQGYTFRVNVGTVVDIGFIVVV